jgi:hypothetical protein
LSHLYIKVIFFPRQARDKHGENSKKARFVEGVFGSEKVMLMNSLGFSSLSLMPSYDGTFSEGRQINAVGLLGAGAAKTSPFPSLPVSEDYKW